MPLAIHNNKAGADADVLKKYGEPAWNNPVVRFLDAGGKDLIPRREGVYDAAGLIERMTAALDAAKRAAPGYLRLAADEASSERVESATFALHCYWEGEKAFGAIDGVVATRAGELQGLEVVEVSYLPSRLPYRELVKKAAAAKCASKAFAHDDRQLAEARAALGSAAVRRSAPAADVRESERKYYLRNSPWRVVPMTPIQQARVNSALGGGGDPKAALSPRQAALGEAASTAVARNPRALDGLAPPAAQKDWPDYERAVATKLAAPK